MSALMAALATIGVVIVVGGAALLARRARRPRHGTSDRGRDGGTDRFDRLDKQVSHYRASGALPRWDP